jgi:hypothetical protein
MRKAASSDVSPRVKMLADDALESGGAQDVFAMRID